MLLGSPVRSKAWLKVLRSTEVGGQGTGTEWEQLLETYWTLSFINYFACHLEQGWCHCLSNSMHGCISIIYFPRLKVIFFKMPAVFKYNKSRHRFVYNFFPSLCDAYFIFSCSTNWSFLQNCLRGFLSNVRCQLDYIPSLPLVSNLQAKVCQNELHCAGQNFPWLIFIILYNPVHMLRFNHETKIWWIHYVPHFKENPSQTLWGAFKKQR